MKHWQRIFSKVLFRRSAVVLSRVGKPGSRKAASGKKESCDSVPGMVSCIVGRRPNKQRKFPLLVFRPLGKGGNRQMSGISLEEVKESSVLARARQDILRLLAGPNGTFEVPGREEAEAREALERLGVLVDRLARLRALSHRFHPLEVSPYVKMAIRAASTHASTKVT